MVKLTGPMMSVDASGTFAKTLVCSKWKGRNYARRWATPSNPQSPLQTGVRSVFKYIAQAFGSLSAAQKAEWDDLAEAGNYTNLNAQIGDAVDRGRRNLGWRIGPDESAGTTPDAPTSPTVTAQPKSLVFSWTRPAGNQGDYTTAVYMSLTGTFTPDISNLVAVVDVTTTSVTIKGLTTGTTYYFECREMNADGEFGADSGEASGAPT